MKEKLRITDLFKYDQSEEKGLDIYKEFLNDLK